jgi:ABC-type antimicrobial peptide transport system permease subunit
LASPRGTFLVRAAAFFAAVLSLLALVLSLLGFYGTVAYVTSQRTREIGVRIALGATAGRIVRLVADEAIRLATLGAAFGVIAAFAIAPLLRPLLFGVTPTDWAAFALAIVCLMVVTFAATWVPARRAARMDPLHSLRSE